MSTMLWGVFVLTCSIFMMHRILIKRMGSPNKSIYVSLLVTIICAAAVWFGMWLMLYGFIK
jgi:hypothetical protein